MAEQNEDVDVEENDPVAYAEFISKNGWKDIPRDNFYYNAIFGNPRSFWNKKFYRSEKDYLN